MNRSKIYTTSIFRDGSRVESVGSDEVLTDVETINDVLIGLGCEVSRVLIYGEQLKDSLQTDGKKENYIPLDMSIASIVWQIIDVLDCYGRSVDIEAVCAYIHNPNLICGR